jgi:hypothetical protein
MIQAHRSVILGEDLLVMACDCRCRREMDRRPVQPVDASFRACGLPMSARTGRLGLVPHELPNHAASLEEGFTALTEDHVEW